MAEKRECCTKCGTPLDANEEGFIDDPEIPAVCPGCGMGLTCTPAEEPEEEDQSDLEFFVSRRKYHASKKLRPGGKIDPNLPLSLAVRPKVRK